MGESNSHYENGPPQTKMHSNGGKHMPRVQEHSTELIFVHFSGHGNWFSKGYLSVWTICCKMDKAALPIYRDTYEFRAFPGINLSRVIEGGNLFFFWNVKFNQAIIWFCLLQAFMGSHGNPCGWTRVQYSQKSAKNKTKLLLSLSSLSDLWNWSPTSFLPIHHVFSYTLVSFRTQCQIL